MNEKNIELPKDLATALLPGETVLWTGSPEEFSLKNDTPAVKHWLLCTAIFAAATLLCALAEKLAGTAFNVLWQLILTVVWAFYMIRPLMDRKKVKNSVYAVTDQRVIVLPGGENRIFGLNRKGLRIKIADGKPECVDALLGSCVNIPDKDHYRRAYFPLGMNTNAGPHGLVFFNVKDNSGLRSVLAD